MTLAPPARVVPPTVFDDEPVDVPHEPPTEPFDPFAEQVALSSFDSDATQSMQSAAAARPNPTGSSDTVSRDAASFAPVPLTPPRLSRTPPAPPPPPAARPSAIAPPVAAPIVTPPAAASANIASSAAPAAAVPAGEALPAAFRATRFHFTHGVPAGQTAQVRDDAGATLLTYPGFATVTGIFAALMSGIVLVGGIASVLFLIAEARPLPALLAMLLSGTFAAAIAMLVPRTTVTLFDAKGPTLTIRQDSRFTFPVARFLVVTPDGKPIAMLRKSFLSRLARHRWTIDAGGGHGQAIEESFSRALIRKFLGKFNRRHDADMLVDFRGAAAATIIRRPNGRGEVDMLDVHSNAADPRVLVALATLVFGAEP